MSWISHGIAFHPSSVLLFLILRPIPVETNDHRKDDDQTNVTSYISCILWIVLFFEREHRTVEKLTYTSITFHCTAKDVPNKLCFPNSVFIVFETNSNIRHTGYLRNVMNQNVSVSTVKESKSKYNHFVTFTFII